jgi:hypothetical protein
MENVCPEVMTMKHVVIPRMQWPIFLQSSILLDIRGRSDFNINVCHKEKIYFKLLESELTFYTF